MCNFLYFCSVKCIMRILLNCRLLKMLIWFVYNRKELWITLIGFEFNK